MLLTFATILELLAFVSFVAAAFGVVARINLVAAGLALWVLSILVVLPAAGDARVAAVAIGRTALIDQDDDRQSVRTPRKDAEVPRPRHTAGETEQRAECRYSTSGHANR